MYPFPCSRTAGDIDIWLNSSKKDVVVFVKRQYPHVLIQYQHVDFPIFKDVNVEIHYIPSVPVSMRYDRKFEKYINLNKNKQFVNIVSLPNEVDYICVPTLEFNIIFQLSHMMKHFFSEGLGMRHIIDYYYVLKATVENSNIEKWQTIRLEMELQIKSLGMHKFAEGIMWVLQEALCMNKEWMICSVNKRRGTLILNEILESGNFGH